MCIRVIRADGTCGIIRSANLNEELKSGEIAAYGGPGGWVRIRRPGTTGSVRS